ncbi:MAG: hypothetical protein KGJ13_02775 [Patescibacteria group bacterium]|nr:hypothetical protein [Patescibacteria group bacterium]
MKKLTAKKDEGLADLIDRVLDEPEKEILLSVPKGSPLGKSARNFNILKNEAELGGKKIMVESSDEGIEALAREAGLAAEPVHGRPVGMSDIIPASGREPKPRAAGKKISEPKVLKLNVTSSEETEVEVEEEEVKPDPKPSTAVERDLEEETEDEERSFFRTAERFFTPRKMEDIEDEPESGSGRRGGKRWAIVIGVVVVVAVAIYGFTVLFGHADIVINFKKTPWQYQGNFTADKAATAISASSGIIPAQIFSIPKNATQLFPASAKQTVSLKAQGTLTIYNAYSAAPQELIATTRFVTPDGKVFRLVQGVTVPGAVASNGQITPSSITAAVVADKSGPDYNVGPVSKLSIPGFQGTAKYDGFYGALPNGTNGGFVGQKAVPTAADIAAAKTKMTSVLQSSLQTGLANAYPSNFKILDGATNVAVTKLSVNTSTDQNGNFSVFGEATMQAVGFDQVAFEAYLLSLAQATESSSTWAAGSPVLNYSNIKADFKNGRISFSVSAQGSLEPAFSPDDFKASIEGMNVNGARTAIAALPQLQDGTISVWPAWLWSIPGNSGKINITSN